MSAWDQATITRTDFPFDTPGARTASLVDINALPPSVQFPSAGRMLFLCLIVMIGTCLGVPVMWLISKLAFSHFIWIIVGVLVLSTLIFISPASKRRIARRFRADTSKLADNLRASDAPIEELLATPGLVVQNGRALGIPTPHLAPALVQSGRAGIAVRINDRKGESFMPIDPLRVSFEPIALNEGDPTFGEVLASNPTTFHRVRENNSADPEVNELHLRWRRFRSNKSSRLVIIFSLLFALSVANYALGYGRLGFFTFVFFMNGPLGLFFALRSRSPLRENWAFPGGLCIGATDVPSRVFRCTNSALIWQASARRLTISNGEYTSVANMTPAEIDLALRAWFSLAPGPTDEQLHGLLPTSAAG